MASSSSPPNKRVRSSDVCTSPQTVFLSNDRKSQKCQPPRLNTSQHPGTTSTTTNEQSVINDALLCVDDRSDDSCFGDQEEQLPLPTSPKWLLPRQFAMTSEITLVKEITAADATTSAQKTNRDIDDEEHKQPNTAECSKTSPQPNDDDGSSVTCSCHQDN
jgi:hypothetical protein